MDSNQWQQRVPGTAQQSQQQVPQILPAAAYIQSPYYQQQQYMPPPYYPPQQMHGAVAPWMIHQAPPPYNAYPHYYSQQMPLAYTYSQRYGAQQQGSENLPVTQSRVVGESINVKHAAAVEHHRQSNNKGTGNYSPNTSFYGARGRGVLGRLKPDPFKDKSATQIVNEFKAQTLPKLRLKRLVRLQAVMRGYHTRKYVVPRKRMTNQLLENYVERFMKHFIEDKMVPDIVLELLTYNKYNEDVSLYSTDYRAHLEIMDKVILKVVRDMSRFTVRESTDNLVGNILRKQQESKSLEDKDPVALVVRDIIVSTIKQDCEEIAKGCVGDLSQEYLSEIHLRQLVRDRFVTRAVKEVVVDAIEEVIIESMVEDMGAKLAQELAQPLATHLYEQVQQEVEGVELDRALDAFVMRGMLDIVLEQIGVAMDDRVAAEKKNAKEQQNFLGDK